MKKIITILVIIIVAGLAYFFSGSDGSNTDGSITDGDGTVELTTYTNNEHNFETKVPHGWTMKVVVPNNGGERLLDAFWESGESLLSVRKNLGQELTPLMTDEGEPAPYDWFCIGEDGKYEPELVQNDGYRCEASDSLYNIRLLCSDELFFDIESCDDLFGEIVDSFRKL